MSDQELLDRFVTAADNQAFAELVRRHVDWVNSMAFRLSRHRAMADDVTQSVFMLLYRKARSLRRETMLSVWLFAATRYSVRNALRNEINRSKREKEVAAMRQEAARTEDAPAWEELAPLLDELVGRLGKTDREAVLLRFYQSQTFAQIGQHLNLSEEATRKRVARSIDYLRLLLDQRGVSVGAASLAIIMSTNLTQPASAAVVAGATAAPVASTTTLLGGGVGWLSLKPIAAILCGLSIVAATSVVLLQQNVPAQNTAAAAPTIVPATAPVRVTSLTRFGKILSTQDKPIAGATVWQLKWSTAINRTISIASTTTDDQGRFRIEEVEDTAEVLVRFGDMALGGGDIRSRWEEDPTEIHLLPKTTLNVQLIAPDGKPAAGVKLALAGCGESRNGWRSEIPPELQKSMEQLTDANGVCSFTNLPQGGIAWIDVLDERFARLGFFPWYELNDADASDGGAVQLKPAASISGRVIFADSGKPAVGVNVKTTSKISGNSAETFTDEQGGYSLKQMRAGEYCVFLFLTDDMSRQVTAVALENLRLSPDVHLVNQDLPLISGGIVRGKITSKETGDPLEKVGVFIDGPSRPSHTHTIQEAMSDKDGVYLMHVPPGKQHIQFALPPPIGLKEPRLLDRDIEVAQGQTVDVDFQVPRSPVIQIKGKTIDPQGRPLSGVEIYVERKELSYSPGYVMAVSDTDGNFSLPPIEPDSVLRARKGKSSALKPELASKENIIFTLERNAFSSIRVKVQQQDGTPVPEAKLELRNDTSNVDQKPAAADGTGVFASLAPDLGYTVVARAKNFGRGEAKVNIAPGKPVEVTLTLPKADSFVGGMVVDEKGEPVPDARVIVRGKLNETQLATTDINGIFRVEGIVPGDLLSLSAYEEPRTREGGLRDVTPGMTNLVITLPAPKN